MRFSLILLSVLTSSPCIAGDIIYDRITKDKVSSGQVEYFVKGKKTGANANILCEDGLFYNDSYIAVFDGATDKSGRLYDGKKGGQVARDLIFKVFKELPSDADHKEILKRINDAYNDFYNSHPDIDFSNKALFRPTATLIWYSFSHKKLYAIGDSKARIDGVEFNKKSKFVDVLNSFLRVKVITDLKLSESDVAKNDIGRYYIQPLLERQSEFQNNPQAPIYFQYWAIDGFSIPDEAISKWDFDKTPSVIELSTDGYEEFPPDSSVASYEKTLFKILNNDPQRIKSPSTKGLKNDDASFDDRSILIYTRGH